MGKYINKKIIIGFIAVAIVLMGLDMLIHSVLLMSAYKEVQNVWRPDMQSKLWILWLNTVIMSYCFTFIYSRGHEGRGVLEGVRYGIFAGLMIEVPVAYGQYVVYPIPYHLAKQWFLYGMGEMIIAGIILSLIFGRKK